MTMFDPVCEVAERQVLESAVNHLREAGVRLPTLSELAEPSSIPAGRLARAGDIGPDEAHARNLFRLHWFNDAGRTGLDDLPGHFILDRSFTGVPAPIVVVLGARFPMIRAHKVLAAYACLVTRLVTGRFDPARHKAVWPSTGNYCRGGVAISRILGCRGVAVLPEGMSTERFDWLNQWVADPGDIIRTPGTESNVKEIYDKCDELAVDPENVILNQFSEFANYLAHYHCTGQALGKLFAALKQDNTAFELAAFVAGTGSSGTLGAGDYLKAGHNTRIVAMEPVECPTMLYNGYGEHNIQGIGDKHIPLIQNVMNMDMVVGISDAGSDALSVLFNEDEGRRYLVENRGIDPETAANLKGLGLSGIANVLAAIKCARTLDLSENQVIFTIATDCGELYGSERALAKDKYFARGFDQIQAGETYARHVLGLGGDHVLDLTHGEKRRIFNLGYYTWVEQRGVHIDDFDRRRDQTFWSELQNTLPAWDGLIEAFNEKTGVE